MCRGKLFTTKGPDNVLSVREAGRSRRNLELIPNWFLAIRKCQIKKKPRQKKKTKTKNSIGLFCKSINYFLNGSNISLKGMLNYF